MGKVVFWIVVFFVILFALRLLNVAKAKRRQAKPPEDRKAIPPAEPTVRCERCGVYLPKSEAMPVPTGYRCSDPACARGR